MTEEDKTFRLEEVNSSKTDKDMEYVEKVVEQTKEDRAKVLNEMQKMNPQERLYFIDRLLFEILISSEFPPFYIMAILDKVKMTLTDVLKPEQSTEEPVQKYRTYYG